MSEAKRMKADVVSIDSIIGADESQIRWGLYPLRLGAKHGERLSHSAQRWPASHPSSAGAGFDLDNHRVVWNANSPWSPETYQPRQDTPGYELSGCFGFGS